MTLAFAFHGPVLDQAIAERGEMPLPPYIASRRAADERGPHRLPDAVRARRRLGRGADRGPAFHRRARGAAGGARHRPAHGHAACRRRHVPAGEGRRHRRITGCTPNTAVVSAETADALNAARSAGGRIVAVGSTSLRLLESAADETARIRPFAGETAIFITPGYRFRAVDVMLTNFHLPRSTLFMLVAAFSGLDTMKRAYAHAIAAGYRFYSYGDACLLFRG